MFQFTTTHVINGSQDLGSNLDLFVQVDDVFQVKGVNNFKKDNVLNVYKAPATEPEMAVLKLDLGKVSDVEKGDTLRLSIYVRLTTADDCSYYANDTQYKGRPFTVEFPWKDSAEDTAKNLKKLINKYGLLVFEKPILDIKQDGAVITLTGKNEFQRFHTYKLEKFVESDKPYAEVWEELDDALTLEVEGKEGFGTYGWILRNIKLPTHEHTVAFAPKAHEMPIPGAMYDQYTLHYCVKRGILGMNAVGEVTKSLTTHVFYVNTNLSEMFNNALTEAGIEVEEVTIPEATVKEPDPEVEEDNSEITE